MQDPRFGSGALDGRWSISDRQSTFSATPDVSLALEGGPGLQRSRGGPRRTSDTSFLSGDLGYLTRDSVSVDEDPQGVISAMQNSMWGGECSFASCVIILLSLHQICLTKPPRRRKRSDSAKGASARFERAADGRPDA